MDLLVQWLNEQRGVVHTHNLSIVYTLFLLSRLSLVNHVLMPINQTLNPNTLAIGGTIAQLR